ncbi:MAG: restriction endonuclease subunit S [Bacteroides oleiciplenus]|nr:restriction endonuclease subunit S [Bacteroides oleiciplenus]
MAEPKIRFREYEGEYNLDKIGNLTDSYSGGTPSAGCSEYYGGKIPFIRSGEIHNDKTELFLTEIGYSVSSAKMVEKGAILYAMYGATSGEVDVCKIKGAINQAILAINPQNDIDSYFLIYFLQNKKKSIISTFLQGGQGNLSGSMIKNITIEYPDIIEQQQIASYFKSLDALIQVTTKKITSLKQLKSASLISMFPQAGETKPRVRFKGFHGDWASALIADKCKIGTGKSNTQDQVENGEFPFFIRSENIVRSNKYLYDCEAVITIGDGNIGKVFHYVNGKFDLHQRCYKMTDFSDEISGEYFFYFFSNFFYERAIKMSAKATVDSVRLDMIADMQLKFPPLAEQKAIAAYFKSLDTLIQLIEKKNESLKQIKSACLDKMFV